MAAYGLYTHIQANRRRSIVLLIGLLLLVYVMTYAGALAAEALLGGYTLEDMLRAAWGHFLSALPVVTLGGLAYANLLAGAVMTETMFSWPGLGRYTFRSAVTVDFPAIMAVTAIVAAIFVLVNFLVDMSYALLDPRVVKK